MQIKLSSLVEQKLEKCERMIYSKYDIGTADAKFAVEILACYLDAKTTQADQLLVLPQIADWAWHELVLDTRAHASLSKKKIHHARISEDEYAFNRSQKFFESEYGICMPNSPEWNTAGWENPRYRFRPHLLTAIRRRDQLSESIVARHYPNELAWLESRLVARFNISMKLARIAVETYWRGLRCGVSGWFPPEALWAWREHVLWTEQYELFCHRHVGQFVNYIPPDDVDFFVRGVTIAGPKAA